MVNASHFSIVLFITVTDDGIADAAYVANASRVMSLLDARRVKRWLSHVHLFRLIDKFDACDIHAVRIGDYADNINKIIGDLCPDWIFIYHSIPDSRYDALFRRTLVHNVSILKKDGNVIMDYKFNHMVTLFKKRFHSLDDDTVSGLLTMYPNRSVTEWETMLDAEVTPSDVDDLLFGNIGMK